MISTHFGFLEDIIANPADDTPRLVYADWLEDEGVGDYAAFVRRSVRAAALGDPEPPVMERLLGDLKTNLWKWFGPCLPPPQGMGMEVPKMLKVLFRERESLVVEMSFRPVEATKPAWRLTIERGFVSRAEMGWKDWMAHGPLLASRQPLEWVGLVDRTPEEFPDGYHYWHGTGPMEDGRDAPCGAPYFLPDRLVGRHSVMAGPRFESVDGANGWLSARCLEWARRPENRPAAGPGGGK